MQPGTSWSDDQTEGVGLFQVEAHLEIDDDSRPRNALEIYFSGGLDGRGAVRLEFAVLSATAGERRVPVGDRSGTGLPGGLRGAGNSRAGASKKTVDAVRRFLLGCSSRRESSLMAAGPDGTLFDRFFGKASSKRPCRFDSEAARFGRFDGSKGIGNSDPRGSTAAWSLAEREGREARKRGSWPLEFAVGRVWPGWFRRVRSRAGRGWSGGAGLDGEAPAVFGP